MRDLPNFVIEATDLEIGDPHSMLLGTVWMSLQDNEVFPIYCNLFNRADHAKAISVLNQEYGRSRETLGAVFDPEPFYREHSYTAPLNENLVQLFPAAVVI